MNTNNITNYPSRVLTESSKPDHDNHRLAIIRWKTKKDKAGKEIPAPSARCVSIPRVSLTVTPECLAVALTSSYEEMQDNVIRELIETAMKNGDANPVISSNDITTEAVAKWHSTKAASGRLSGENIKAWFAASLSDKLQLALAEAMKLPEEPTAEQVDKLETVIHQHEDLITSLASPRAAMSEKLATQLRKAVELGDDDGRIKPALLSKLDAFLAPKEELNLGFSLGA